MYESQAPSQAKIVLAELLLNIDELLDSLHEEDRRTLEEAYLAPDYMDVPDPAAMLALQICACLIGLEKINAASADDAD